MQLTHIAIENLSISALNMRHSKRAPDISDILPSVRTRGVLVPLLVRPNGTGSTYEIVAGRRRYFAAKAAAEEKGAAVPLPCAVMEDGDDADALEASLIENIARQEADEMTQYEVFTRLIVKEGRSIEQIAATFGLTERQVQQRLALGNLLPKIRDAYRAEQIDADTIRYLTMATKRQQGEWLKMFEADDAPFGHGVKQWLFGGTSIPTKVALFSLEDYAGQITADLFGEDSYFTDPDLFWQKQNEAIAARRDAYLEAGWTAVAILEPGQTFNAWEHEKTAKKKGGKVFVAVSHRGEVNFYEGYVTRKEAQRAARKAEKETPDAGETEKASTPEVTGAMQTYIDLHRHAAVRAKLADDTGVALRLMVALAIGGSRLWSVKPEPQRSGREETDASVKASAGQIVFEERRMEALALLGLPEGCGLVSGHAESTAVIFARLRDLPHKDVMRVLAAVMADSLEAGSALVEAVGVHLQVDLHKTWTPDDAFFDLLRDKSVVNAMVAEITGKAVANGNVAATGKVQKQIIRDCLAGTNGREKVTGWLPRWFAFPVQTYRKD
ncbi:MAG: ParB/RepB/Spo0J family partition protein, partial [Rhodospirillaceae bacterium]|nr:ParB/RepB/Spo0J family partition protein [Rhodospirillaceae bacterium]